MKKLPTTPRKTKKIDPLDEMTTDEKIAQLKRHHRRRRFAMKIQQKLDRALESFIRMNATSWHPDLPEVEREKINKEVRALIKRIREGEPSEHKDVIETSDEARAPADKMRAASELDMEKIARTLPVFKWIESIHGAGEKGLATIVAEAGNISDYPNPAKLWKRLGFASYDGYAGSTWKRDTWRPRKLTKEEWRANPFSGERYALMHQNVVWLVNAQWIGKAKTESGEGEPDGPYGEIYANRRKHTLKTHPDWTDGHRRMDALRVTMKEFLKHLYNEWQAIEGKREEDEPDEVAHLRRSLSASRAKIKKLVAAQKRPPDEEQQQAAE